MKLWILSVISLLSFVCGIRRRIRTSKGCMVGFYGVLLHAWNITFFTMLFSRYGKFLKVDYGTKSRSRLYYATIRVSTTRLNIINLVEETMVDAV